jgi:hypothetical protein
MIAVLIAFMLAGQARADDVSLTTLKGINHSDGSYAGSIAYAQDLPKVLNPFGLFFIEEQATVYTDPFTFIGSVGPGFEYTPTALTYVRVTMGVSGLTRTNDELGGHFQFILKSGAGVKFNMFGNQFRVGPVYAHYSSAGIYKRNSGADFVGIELGVELPQEYTIADE